MGKRAKKRLAAFLSPSTFSGMKGFNLTLSYGDVSDAERVFNALSDGGTVTMPFQEQFWAERAGMLVDRFGTPWIVTGAVKEV